MVVLVINTATSQFRTTIPRHESTLCMGTNYATTWLQRQHLFGAKPNDKIYTKNKLEFSHYFCNLVIIFAIQLLFMQFSYQFCNLVIIFAIQLVFCNLLIIFAIQFKFLLSKKFTFLGHRKNMYKKKKKTCPSSFSYSLTQKKNATL